jgi:hypothetical protein
LLGTHHVLNNTIGHTNLLELKDVTYLKAKNGAILVNRLHDVGLGNPKTNQCDDLLNRDSVSLRGDSRSQPEGDCKY